MVGIPAESMVEPGDRMDRSEWPAASIRIGREFSRGRRLWKAKHD